ncbi:beta-1,3-glucanase family protein [Clostridium felsineum]|uniref:Uncharacterized protein n=1 Tax=Clostridium felsineum TaxID=36839 RepID=A0A1S8LK04_9CLOT|nr:beta-1,3-glucanase family protein [Clostridium felsineum]URZ09269.1 hypothetical protein CLROS_046850 [Clostridium felsineum]URZ13955.1 hypothetical protein CROST_047330 [Clostridium felsineum]
MLRKIPSVFTALIITVVLLLTGKVSVYAADYTSGVTVSGTTATIWFKSTVNTSWVDVHYTLNSGIQQNFRMTYNNTTARYEKNITNVVNGNIINYSFTYNNGTPAYNTSTFNYTVGDNSSTVATPSISPSGGSYTAAQNVTINCATSGATIRYTTDGSTPTASSQVYSGPISVTSSKTIKAIATASGMNDSQVASATYTINGSQSTNLIPLNSGMQMTVQFNNNTNGAWNNSQIYVNIIGRNQSGQFCTIAPNGIMTPCVSGQNAASYFYPLSSMSGFQIPSYVSSGRLYISMGAPLNIAFNKAADGTVGIAYPNIENPSDPSYKSYFDWAEFAVINGQIWINTTQVDMFGLPYTVELFTGSSTSYSSLAKVGITESRDSIFSEFKSQVPAQFTSLATQQAPYRILAPIHGGFRSGQTNGTYFDSYINSIWNQYTTSNFVVTIPQGTFTGRVFGTTMNLTRQGDYQVYHVNKPKGDEVWGGSGALATGNDIEKALEAQICAAFHRHVMDNAVNLNNPYAYYQTGAADYFSKFWHDHSLNSRAYGFCYDDVNDQSSTIHGVSPRGAVINIGW